MRRSKVLLLSTTVLMVAPLLFAQPPAKQLPPGHTMEMPPGQTMQQHMQRGPDPGAMPEMNCQAMMDKMHASQQAMDERLGEG